MPFGCQKRLFIITLRIRDLPGLRPKKVALTEQLLEARLPGGESALFEGMARLGQSLATPNLDPGLALWAHPEHWQWNRQAIGLGYAQSLAEHHYVMGQNLSGRHQKTSFLLASGTMICCCRVAGGAFHRPKPVLKAESLMHGEAFQEAAEVYKRSAYGDERNQHSEMEQADSYALIDSLRHLATAGMEEAFWTEVLQAEQMFLQQFERDLAHPQFIQMPWRFPVKSIYLR